MVVTLGAGWDVDDQNVADLMITVFHDLIFLCVPHLWLWEVGEDNNVTTSDSFDHLSVIVYNVKGWDIFPFVVKVVIK